MQFPHQLPIFFNMLIFLAFIFINGASRNQRIEKVSLARKTFQIFNPIHPETPHKKKDAAELATSLYSNIYSGVKPAGTLEQKKDTLSSMERDATLCHQQISGNI
jgi:hypothetical protein